MAKLNFEPNSQVFTESGQVVELVAATEDGYIVRPLLRRGDDDEESEPFYGAPQHAARIYAEPPVEMRDAKVVELDSRIEIKRAELDAIRQDIHQATAERQAILSRLKQHAALKYIDDFIEGRITHFVVVTSESVLVEDAATTLKEDPERSYSTEIKLLTLYGNTKGDLQWRLNTYRDGSGSNREVYPCMSEAEGDELARKVVAGQIASEAESKKLTYFAPHYIKSADRLGIPVPEALRARVRADRVATAQHNVDRLRKELSTAETNLASIPPLAAEAANA